MIPQQRRWLDCQQVVLASISAAQRRYWQTVCEAILLFGSATSLRTVTLFWTATSWCPDGRYQCSDGDSASSSYDRHSSCNVRLPPVDNISMQFRARCRELCGSGIQSSINSYTWPKRLTNRDVVREVRVVNSVLSAAAKVRAVNKTAMHAHARQIYTAN